MTAEPRRLSLDRRRGNAELAGDLSSPRAREQPPEDGRLDVRTLEPVSRRVRLSAEPDTTLQAGVPLDPANRATAQVETRAFPAPIRGTAVLRAAAVRAEGRREDADEFGHGRASAGPMPTPIFAPRPKASGPRRGSLRARSR